MAELELKGKPTQLILYRSVEIDDEWLITIEALHYDKHAPFWEVPPAKGLCKTHMLIGHCT